MLLSRDNCSTCVNNTHGTSVCCYQSQYVDALAALDEFLDRYKPVTEWFGCLRATCDYYIPVPCQEATACCPPTYTWKDLVRIKVSGEYCYRVEEFPISGKMDDDTHYQIDDFIKSVASKYLVPEDLVDCYMLDSFEFPDKFEDQIVSLGCYISGVPEWLLKKPEVQE